MENRVAFPTTGLCFVGSSEMAEMRRQLNEVAL